MLVHPSLWSKKGEFITKMKTENVHYFLRPEYGVEDKIGTVYGPYKEFLQITYSYIRDRDGNDIATMGPDQFWRIAGSDEPWSDIVIWAVVLEE